MILLVDVYDGVDLIFGAGAVNLEEKIVFLPVILCVITLNLAFLFSLAAGIYIIHQVLPGLMRDVRDSYRVFGV